MTAPTDTSQVLAVLGPGEAWALEAACVGFPTEWWFPEQGRVTDENREAKRICWEECEVRRECAAYRDENALAGVWGGDSRSAIRRRRQVQRQQMSIDSL